MAIDPAMLENLNNFSQAMENQNSGVSRFYDSDDGETNVNFIEEREKRKAKEQLLFESKGMIFKLSEILNFFSCFFVNFLYFSCIREFRTV